MQKERLLCVDKRLNFCYTIHKKKRMLRRRDWMDKVVTGMHFRGQMRPK